MSSTHARSRSWKFRLSIGPASRTIVVIARGESHALSYFDRDAGGTAILYVHGLGASKRDFAEMCSEPALADHRLIAYDHPGCNESVASVDRADSIDELVEILQAFVIAMELKPFLLVGGSLGGLVSLIFAERFPDRIIGFVNVEGNLAPEDCLFSRNVIPHSFVEFERTVFPRIKSDLAARPGRGFACHLMVLEAANSRAYYVYSFQTVAYSDGGNLLERFLNLPLRTFFFYGSDNSGLSYLPRLRRSRCSVTEIPSANHFLFYDAPADYAAALRACAATCVDSAVSG